MSLHLVPLFLSCLLIPVQDGKPNADHDKLLGAWTLVEGQRGGKPFPPDRTQGVKLFFEKDKLAISRKDRLIEFKYTLPADKQPKEIDLDLNGAPGLGIYDLQGDTLKIAHGEANDPRPKDFAVPGESTTFLTLRRYNPRSVKDNVITSTEMPAVRLEFDKAFKYAGAQTFILYGVAQAEQHFFVDADSQGSIKRLYWLQFENYLPHNTHAYNYKSPKKADLGGLDFFADAYARNTKGPERANSDGSRARIFLESRGYRRANPDWLLQRLVHLADQEKRQELMIIYMEDLTPTGLTAADLAPNGPAAGRWEEISKGLLQRATAGIKLSR